MPEDNYIANLMGALAQIDAGTTTLVDWCHNITTLEHAERAVDGLIDTGIRAVFAHGTAKPPTKPGDKPFHDVPHPRDRIEALRKGRLSSQRRPRHAGDGDPRPGLGKLGGGRARHSHGARVRPRVVVAHAAARGLRRQGRLRAHAEGRPARPRSQSRARHELRRSRSARSSSTAAPRSPRPCWSSCITTSAIRMVARVREAGMHAVDRHRRRALRLRPDVPRDAGGAPVRARQGGAQQCGARQLDVQDHAGEIARGADLGDGRRRARVPAWKTRSARCRPARRPTSSCCAPTTST